MSIHFESKAGTMPRFLAAAFVFLAVVAVIGCGDDGEPTEPVADTVPPSSVADLEVASVGTGGATLRWTAPGDDGMEGRASVCEIRCMAATPGEWEWDAASPVSGVAAPAPAGTLEEHTITGLLPATDYCAALKCLDEAANASGLSNVVDFTTLSADQGGFSVEPEMLDFGSSSNHLPIEIASQGNSVAWSASVSADWMIVEPSEGVTTAWADTAMVTVLRSGLIPGSYQGWIHVSSESGTDSVETVMWVAEPVPLTLVAEGGNDPTASPDGRWIAYTDTLGLLRKVGSDGGDSEILALGYHAAWSPRGDVILFDWEGALYAVSPEGGEPRELYSEVYVSDPSWSPEGRRIVCHDGEDQMRMISYPQGSLLGLIPCSDPDGTVCEFEGPSWSGRDDWIAFEDGTEILRLPVEGGMAEVVVGGLNDVAYPAYSPDGRWIAFHMANDGHDTGSNIWVADARGQSFGLHQVTDSDSDKYSPCWSPDSRTIYFEEERADPQWPGHYYDRAIWKIGFTPR